jgi:tRNA dimethylallyltransferase
VPDSNQPQIVVICGPTGVGKTGFAIALAQRFGGEIVGADSMQIYRRMDIGTAKPTPDERAAATHHMVDVVDLDEGFDAADYARQAGACVARIKAAGKVPFVVGGTGLYIKALLYGLTQGLPSAPQVRAQLQGELSLAGVAVMHQRLCRVDPDSARRIHPNDSYRIIRALEVFAITGRSITDHHRHHRFAQPAYSALQIGLTLPRQVLYERIDRRVEMMLDAGLVDEVWAFLDQGFSPALKSMQALGYRHMVDFIQGRLAWDEAVRTLKRDHRRYAKRQLTWFGAVEGIHWLAPDQTALAIQMVADFIH